MIDMTTPQALAAQAFMEHKGLGYVEPYDEDKLEDQPCWYFLYKVDDRILELEVAWDPTDGWEVMTTAFSEPHEDDPVWIEEERVEPAISHVAQFRMEA